MFWFVKENGRGMQAPTFKRQKVCVIWRINVPRASPPLLLPPPCPFSYLLLLVFLVLPFLLLLISYSLSSSSITFSLISKAISHAIFISFSSPHFLYHQHLLPIPLTPFIYFSHTSSLFYPFIHLFSTFPYLPPSHLFPPCG